jgi:hypothetical protein
LPWDSPVAAQFQQEDMKSGKHEGMGGGLAFAGFSYLMPPIAFSCFHYFMFSC